MEKHLEPFKVLDKARIKVLSKRTLLYGALFILTAYGNSYGVVRYSVLWIGAISFIVGLFHHKHIERGLTWYLTPFIILMVVALLVNYQVFWSYDALVLASGFAFGVCLRRLRWLSTVSAGITYAFVLIASFQYAEYHFNHHYQRTRNTNTIINQYIDSNHITIVQFTIEHCGQFLRQIEFLYQFLSAHPEITVDLLGVHRPFKGNPGLAHRKFAPLVDNGLSMYIDEKGQLCKSLDIHYFPVLMIIDQSGAIVHRIDGFSGDMTFIYETKLLYLIQSLSKS